MGKIFFLFTIFLSTLITLTSPKIAKAETAGSSAVLIITNQTKIDDNRIQTLRAFLENRNSPLAPYANVFVNEADKNNLDWKLVAAISGLESSFGLHIPAYSNNGWGFGIYGDNVLKFSSWEDYTLKSDLVPYFPKIKIPTLVICSYDDPISPARVFENIKNPNIITLLTKHGGHGGFFTTKKLYGDLDGHWAQNRVMEFIRLIDKK